MQPAFTKKGISAYSKVPSVLNVPTIASINGNTAFRDTTIFEQSSPNQGHKKIINHESLRTFKCSEIMAQFFSPGI